MPKKSQKTSEVSQTIKNHARVAGNALVELTVFGVGLTNIFNPVSLGVLGVYAAYKAGPELLTVAAPVFRKWELSQMIKEGHAEAVPEDAPVSLLAKEISDSTGRPEAPRLYIIDPEALTEIDLPQGVRKLAKLASFKQMFTGKSKRKVFAALPGLNIMVTTKEALAKNLPEDEMRLVVANEMAHLKTDALTPSEYGKQVVKTMKQPLSMATGAATVLSLFDNMGIPLTLSIGAVRAGKVLFGLKTAEEAPANPPVKSTRKKPTVKRANVA